MPCVIPGNNFQDPRRLDPRRAVATGAGAAVSVMEDTGSVKSEFDDSLSLSKPVSHPVVTTVDNISALPTAKIKSEDIISEGPPILRSAQPIPQMEVQDTLGDIDQNPGANACSDPSLSAADIIDEDLSTVKLLDTESKETDSSSVLELDQLSPDATIESTSEDTCVELPQLPPYVELSKDRESNIKYMAIKRMIESYKHLYGTDCQQFCMPLLAQMVAQVIFFFGCSISVFILKIYTSAIVFDSVSCAYCV